MPTIIDFGNKCYLCITMKRDENLKIEEKAAAEIKKGKNIFVDQSCIFRCTAGWATIMLNGNLARFEAGTNFMIIDSASLRFEELSDEFRYSLIVFGRKSFNRIYTHFDTAIINTLRSSAPDLAPREAFRQSELTLDKITMLNGSVAENKRAIMRNLIFCYIYEIYEIARNGTQPEANENSKFVNSLISRFIVLCRQNHTRHRDIAFYSAELAISRRYLHAIVVAKLQVTPKEFIDGYVITAAKQMLLNTTDTTAQIAEKLNFADQSSFGQFFKRITGISPTQFRKEH